MKTLTHRFKPRGAARQLFEARDDEVILDGPAGTGKSRACLEKIHMMCLMNPGMSALMVRKTAVSLTTSGIKTWERDVVKEAMLDGSVWFHGGSSREPASYKYSNGSQVCIGGMDKPQKIMSTEYDLIYVQELTELFIEDWEAATSRLRNGRVSFQQMIGDCNPDHPNHWANQRANSGKMRRLLSRHEDNPRYFDENGKMTPEGVAYIKKLDNLTGVRYQRLRKGLWVAAEGVIYEEWDPAVHLIDRFDVPAHWPRYWGIDFGYTNPFVWQDWTADPDGRLILVREIYHTGRLVADHARKVRELHTDAQGNWIGQRPQFVVTDHDAEDRATWEKELGATRPAQKNVKQGIENVALRIRKQGDGKPRLFIMRDACVETDQSLLDARKPACTADEIPGYIWADKGKDAPVKLDDHGCDTKRYIIQELDNQQVAKMRGWL